jgi:hypothetical protein
MSKLYGIQNKKGQWHRLKASHSYRKLWVDSIEDAKIWAKLREVKSRLTFLNNNSDEIYFLVEINIKDILVVK